MNFHETDIHETVRTGNSPLTILAFRCIVVDINNISFSYRMLIQGTYFSKLCMQLEEFICLLSPILHTENNIPNHHQMLLPFKKKYKLINMFNFCVSLAKYIFFVWVYELMISLYSKTCSRY